MRTPARGELDPPSQVSIGATPGSPFSIARLKIGGEHRLVRVTAWFPARRSPSLYQPAFRSGGDGPGNGDAATEIQLHRIDHFAERRRKILAETQGWLTQTWTQR